MVVIRFLTQIQKQLNEERVTFSANGGSTTEYPYAMKKKENYTLM